MKFSIIIPSYNQKEYLSQAIDSALNQKGDYEIIIVDDGSTDGSLDIAKGYAEKHENVRCISQVNKGLASARNTGLMNAKGDYILPLDADDILLTNCLEGIEEAYELDVDIYGLSFRVFGNKNGVVHLLQDIDLTMFQGSNMLGYCSCYKKETALAIGGYSPKMVKGYEDMHFWIDLIKRGARVKTIETPLWMYRTRDDSMINTSIKHHDELMAQIKFDHPELYAQS